MWRADIMQTGDAPCQFSTNSLVVLNDHSHASQAQPPTEQCINIIKSSRVHIGPNIVTVTQNLQKTQVTQVTKERVRFLGLTLLSSMVLAAFALATYFIFVAVHTRLPLLDIGLTTSWYLRRADWQARDPQRIELLDLPVTHVIISQTKSKHCNHRYTCIKHMLELQQDHIMRGFNDISPNFLVSGNGLVFEGRGANIMGSVVRYYNARSVSIAFMGDYMVDEAVEEQFDHINLLLEALVNSGVLNLDYTLYAHCQVQPDVGHPGLNVIKNLETFSHWNNDNSTGCLIK